MSHGSNLVCAIVKSGNKNLLNRVRDDLLSDKPQPGEKLSEKQAMTMLRTHVMTYKVLPSPEVLRIKGVEFKDVSQPAEYYVEEIKKRAIYNAYKKFCTAASPYIQGGAEPTDIVPHIIDFHNSVAKLAASDSYKSVQQLGREIEFEVEQRRNGAPDVFVPFGWPTLDRLTGGAGAGDLCYFVARPGMGKSQLITHMSHHAWTQGFSPLVLTMEMTDIQIGRRLFGIQGQFNHSTLRKGVPDNETHKKLTDAIESFEEKDKPAFNIMCGSVRQTVESITSLVDELMPDALYIDAAYLINMQGSNAKTWEKLAMIGEKLKALAISRGIPIILTVQFNRDAAKKNNKDGSGFSLENIAGSDSIGQLGSVVVAIKPGEGQYEETQRILEVLKNREGGVEEFAINFGFSPPNYEELSATRVTEETVDYVP